MPQGSVKTAIIGSNYPQIKDALEGIGITPICIPDNNCIAYPVRAHADMSAYYCGDGKLILSRNIADACTVETFPAGTVIINSAETQREKYPFDIGLNACEIGDYIFCKRDNIDAEILKHAVDNGKKIINVRQGYSKCSVCILDEKHIITSDNSIASAAADEGIEVLLITPGFFTLPGYDYGFIGGSCFKPDKITIAFTGTLSGHPDEAKILKFIENAGINVTYLTTELCFDIGSVIPLTEER